jgi:pimeloyl-ACP methyl ester carboxylesterase
LKYRIHRIAALTLIVWGVADQIVEPLYAEEFAKRIAGARIALIENAGHLPHLEALDHAAKLTAEFLRR